MHNTGPRDVLDSGLQLESLKRRLHSVGFKVRSLPATAQATSFGKLWKTLNFRDVLGRALVDTDFKERPNSPIFATGNRQPHPTKLAAQSWHMQYGLEKHLFIIRPSGIGPFHS